MDNTYFPPRRNLNKWPSSGGIQTCTNPESYQETSPWYFSISNKGWPKKKPRNNQNSAEWLRGEAIVKVHRPLRAGWYLYQIAASLVFLGPTTLSPSSTDRPQTQDSWEVKVVLDLQVVTWSHLVWPFSSVKEISVKLRCLISLPPTVSIVPPHSVHPQRREQI